MTTGAAATSRFVNVSTAAATQNSIMPTKNTRRPSRSRSRLLRTVCDTSLADRPVVSILTARLNLAASMLAQGNYAEAKAFLGELVSDAERLVGPGNIITIHARGMYAISLYGTDDDAAFDDLILAEKVLEETNRTARQVLGRGHPTAQQMLKDLSRVREKLARVRANP